MRSPLRYQATQYDCGPTTMTNAVMYLFEREEIPPDLVRHIGQCTLDSYDRRGHCGMCGTTGAAIRYFGTWLNELRFSGLLPVESSYLDREDVWFGAGSPLSLALQEGAAVVLHVFHTEGHYILVTEQTADGVYALIPIIGETRCGGKGSVRSLTGPFPITFLYRKVSSMICPETIIRWERSRRGKRL